MMDDKHRKPRYINDLLKAFKTFFNYLKREGHIRFKEAILEFGFDCRARKLSDKTISNYQKQLRYLERYLGAEYGISEVEEVRSLHLKEFLVSMDEKERKPRYINDLLKVFKT